MRTYDTRPRQKAGYLPLQELPFPLHLEDGKQVLDWVPIRSYPGLQEKVQLVSVTIPEHCILPCHGGSIFSQGWAVVTYNS